jgi:deoxyribodipyrimidine photo-lyase
LVSPVIHWFRNDLRLADNCAFAQACAAGGPVLPVYVHDDAGSYPPGGASRWWLHHSLASLDGDLRAQGSRLLLRAGPTAAVLAGLARETGAGCITFSRGYEPGDQELDTRLRSALDAQVELRPMAGRLLFEPAAIRSGSGRPYQVFTAFWKACLAALPPGAPLPAPRSVPLPERWPRTEELSSLRLLPVALDWSGGLFARWRPGEGSAMQRLDDFLAAAIAAYGHDRDFPARAGTSRLSPHLHFGEISPRQVWHVVRTAMAAGTVPEGAGAAFLREIGWREFSAHLLHHHPHLPEQPLRPEFAEFPWEDDATLLRAWQRGRTGYPIVDAGMRELWDTGWMHNRVRMIVASFLVKHLLVPWQAGAAWFHDTLVDADLASNTASWQWVAGCGADAAPFFRIFNPVLQGRKFDPDGSYVRAHLPQLARVPARFVHAPWEAPAEVLATAGVRLGADYPLPVVDHGQARARALDAFARLRGSSAHGGRNRRRA